MKIFLLDCLYEKSNNERKVLGFKALYEHEIDYFVLESYLKKYKRESFTVDKIQST